MIKGYFKAMWLKFVFRSFAVFDVIFAEKFELKVYGKNGVSETNFDKLEIEEVGRVGLL